MCVYVDKHVYCISLYTCIQVCNYNIYIWMYMDILLCPVFGYLYWILHLGPGGFCHCDHLVFRGTPLPPSIGRMNKKMFGTSTHLFMVRLFGTPSSRKDDVLSQWCLLHTYWGKNFETIFWIAVVSCESMLPFFVGSSLSALDVGFGCAPVVPPPDVTWENKKGAWTVSAEITKEHEFQFSHTEAWMMLEEWQDW